MTLSRSPFVLAAALAATMAFSGAAFAQSGAAVSPSPNAAVPGATSAAPGPATSAARPQTSAAPSAATRSSDTRVEARIKQLHSELKITADQEKEWNDLAQVMRENAQQMSGLIDQRRATSQAKPVSAVDNLRNYQQIADAHAQGLQKLVPVFQTLYDKMSPTQKQTADKLFNQRISQRVHTTATPSSGSHGHS